MKKPFILLFGLLLLGILGYFCIYQHVPVIQNDIDTRAHAALLEQNLDDITIVTDGRDITLIGEVDTIEAKKSAKETVQQVDGVRAVKNQLIIANPKLNEEKIQPPELEPLPIDNDQGMEKIEE